MERGDLPDVELQALVTLAEAVEQVSRDGLPVVQLLDELGAATDRSWGALAPGCATVEPRCVARWRRVLASVRRDVEHGRVRSVSGLAAEARRLAMEIEHRGEVSVPS